MGERTRVEISNLDRRVRIRVNGRTCHEQDYERSRSVEEGIPSNQVFFGVDRAGIDVHDVEVFRDLYYTADGDCGVRAPAVIPDGSGGEEPRFFVLGDNSAKSYDSRSWGSDVYEATIPRSHLVGTPFLIFWPPGRARVLD
jgi:hypothetical protein